jgi:cupin 2 domain-containing protein
MPKTVQKFQRRQMNIYNYTTPTKGEKFTTLLEHQNIKIIRIVSASDFNSIEYCQDEDEWVVLLEGRAILRVGEKEITLKRGETLFIPARTPHQILEMQSGTLWLAVHIFSRRDNEKL